MADAPLSDFLLKSHLFRHIRTDDIAALANTIDTITLADGETLFAQGNTGSGLFFVYKGKIRIFHQTTYGQQELGILIPGDYLGLDSLTKQSCYSYTAIAADASVLLRIDSSQILEFTRKVPTARMRDGIEMAIRSRSLTFSTQFDWLDKEEVIHLVTFQHPLFLIGRLLLPILLGLSSIILFMMAIDLPLSSLFYAGIGLVLVAVAWAFWIYLDYYNDYFVVTNKRVVWIEKVIGLYDSRIESPLSRIRSLDSISSWVARQLGYGTVMINTFTGSITFRNVQYTQQIIDLIQELQDRAKQRQFVLKEQTMRELVRQQLHPPPKAAASSQKPATTRQRIDWKITFKMRSEDGQNVTFRKHWIILIAKVWLPLLSVIGSCVIIGFGLFQEQYSQTLLLVGWTLLLITACWSAYHYVDWRNDIYRVTPEQVIDIERRPFGKETKVSAPLESILSLSVERKNLIGIIFNYGDVIIDAGGTKLCFHNIYDPSTSQLDISGRMDAQKRRKEEAQFAEDNKRITEFLAAYHREVNP